MGRKNLLTPTLLMCICGFVPNPMVRGDGPKVEILSRSDVTKLLESTKSLPFDAANDVSKDRSGNVRIDPSLLKDKDPRVRGISLCIMASDSDFEGLKSVASLLEDSEKTIPRLQSNGYQYFPVDQTVGELAGTEISQRLGTFGLDPVFESADSLKNYLASVKNSKELPSEWVYRFQKMKEFGEKSESLKGEMTKVGAPARAILICSVAVAVSNIYSDKEVIEILREDLDSASLRKLVEGKWEMPGVNLMSGPNQKSLSAVRSFAMRHANELLKKEDADWVMEASRSIGNYQYVVAAAKLDPSRGVSWLKGALEKEKDQSNQCKYLVALASISADDGLKYVADAYFAASSPRYNTGGLQEEFVQSVASGNDQQKASDVLKAIISDERFLKLSWPITRAFAHHSKLILGRQTAEADRFLRVEFARGEYDYLHRPEYLEQHVVDTKHVQQQTKIFQAFLQVEVTKEGKKP